MPWDTQTEATQATVGNSWTDIGSSVTPTPGEVHHEQIEADFPTSPTDHGEFRVLTSTADSDAEWDTTPLITGRLDNGTDPNAMSFTIAGIKRYKVQVRSTGSTDTIDFTRRYAGDGVDI